MFIGPSLWLKSRECFQIYAIDPCLGMGDPPLNQQVTNHPMGLGLRHRGAALLITKIRENQKSRIWPFCFIYKIISTLGPIYSFDSYNN